MGRLNHAMEDNEACPIVKEAGQESAYICGGPAESPFSLQLSADGLPRAIPDWQPQRLLMLCMIRHLACCASWVRPQDRCNVRAGFVESCSVKPRLLLSRLCISTCFQVWLPHA